jgi:hypothetical protein
MTLPYSDKFIPIRRRGAMVLLESVDYDVDFLTVDQLAAVRILFWLEDGRTIRELVLAGEL